MASETTGRQNYGHSVVGELLGKAELACREIDDVEMVGKEMVDVPGVHIDAKS